MRKCLSKKNTLNKHMLHLFIASLHSISNNIISDILIIYNQEKKVSYNVLNLAIQNLKYFQN